MSEDRGQPAAGGEGLGPAPFDTPPGGYAQGGQAPGWRPAPPDPEVAARYHRLGRRAMWLGGLSLLFSLFFYPLGIVAGILALVLGVRALRAARPYRDRVQGAVPGVVMGCVGLAFSLLVTAFAVLLYNEISTYTKCRDTANTISDETQCKDAFARALEKKLHLKRGSFDGGKLPF